MAHIEDRWEKVGYPNGPNTWNDLRQGGKKIKEQLGNPVGVGLSQELDTNMAMRALLWSFGASVQDAAGNVRITGRTKDIINRGGVKFNPRDVEDLVDSHPKVLQSAIVPMPDPILGERACCFVTLRPGIAALELDELVAYLLEKKITKTKLPEKLVVLKEMPLTPTRKVIKGRLVAPS